MDNNKTIDPRSILKDLSSQDFRNFGLQQVAYMKPVVAADQVRRFAVCGADGTVLTVLPTANAAIAAIIHNDLEAITLH